MEGLSLILVTGSTGFVGRHLVKELTARGWRLKCLVRRSSDLRVLSGLDVEFCYGDVTEPGSLEVALSGVETAIHLVAIIRESGQATFQRINHEGTVNLVGACQRAGVQRVIYMSNLGVGPDPTFPLLYSKWRGEEAVRESGLAYIILRPSVIFGPGDGFVSRLASLVRRMPLVPIVGDGRTRFQPIWVGDMARCLAVALKEERLLGQVVPLGGPEHLTYEEIIDIVIEALKVRRLKVHVPVSWMLPAARALELLPHPLVTRAQLAMLRVDNITALDVVKRTFGFAPIRLRDGLGYISRTAR